MKKRQPNQKGLQKITFHIVTLFPQMFDSYLNESILKRAIDDKKIAVKFYNPRDFTVATGISEQGKKVWTYADRRVDDKAYGGGPGMVIEALPVVKAIDRAVGKKIKTAAGKRSTKIIFFSPAGKLLDTAYAKETAKKYTDIVFVCGRYEGVDARIKSIFKMEDVSVGPFVLTGGELPAMIMIDTLARQVPSVLGDIASLEETRISSSDVYTRPETVVFKGKKYRVPKVLLSGNHKLIDEWRSSRKNNSRGADAADAANINSGAQK